MKQNFAGTSAKKHSGTSVKLPLKRINGLEKKLRETVLRKDVERKMKKISPEKKMPRPGFEPGSLPIFPFWTKGQYDSPESVNKSKIDLSSTPPGRWTVNS